MNEKLIKKLAVKGWNKEEIRKTEEILKKSKIKRSKRIILLDKYVYWIALFVGIVGNSMISISLIPFLVTLKGFKLYFVIVVLGISFGLFFEILIRGIENLEKKHHLVAGIVIPCLALINMYLITIFSYNLGSATGLENLAHAPLMIGFVYAVSFIAPYVLYQVAMKK